MNCAVRSTLSADHKPDGWNVAVAEGALMTLPGELWRLDRRLNVAFADGGFAVSRALLAVAGWSRSRMYRKRGRARRAGPPGRARSTRCRLRPFAVRFDGVADLTGTVSGRWDVESNAGSWRGVAALETNGFGIIQQATGQAAQTIGLPKVSANIELANDRAKVRLLATSGEERVLDLTADVLGFDSAAGLAGHATVAVRDLGFLATFTRRIGELNGALNGEFDIGGTVAQPIADGRAADSWGPRRVDGAARRTHIRGRVAATR